MKRSSIIILLFALIMTPLIFGELPQVIITPPTTATNNYVLINSTVFNITNNITTQYTNNITNYVYNNTENNITNNITSLIDGNATGLCPSGQTLQNLTVMTNATGFYITSYECVVSGGGGSDLYWNLTGSVLYVVNSSWSVQSTSGIATGFSSFAETSGQALADYSHAETYGIANGTYSHAESWGYANGVNSHAETFGVANGDRSHAETQSVANGYGSHTEGNGLTQSTAIFSHAEAGSYVLGFYSHADSASTVSGNYSHANSYSTVDGSNSFGTNGANNPFNNYFMSGGSGAFTDDYTKIPLQDDAVTPLSKFFVSSPDVNFDCAGDLTACSDVTADPPCSSISGCEWGDCQGSLNCHVYDTDGASCSAHSLCSAEYDDCSALDYPGCLDNPGCTDNGDNTCTGTYLQNCNNIGSCSDLTPEGSSSCDSNNDVGCSWGSDSSPSCVGTIADTDCTQIDYASCSPDTTSGLCSQSATNDLVTHIDRAGNGQSNDIYEAIDGTGNIETWIDNQGRLHTNTQIYQNNIVQVGNNINNFAGTAFGDHINISSGVAIGGGINVAGSGVAVGTNIPQCSGVCIGNNARGDASFGFLADSTNGGLAMGSTSNGSSFGVALGNNAQGHQGDVAIGTYAGYGQIGIVKTGFANIFLGEYAGVYENSSVGGIFEINNRDWGNQISERANSFMYGQMSSTIGASNLTINARLTLPYGLNASGNATINNIYGEMWFHNDTVLNTTVIAASGTFYNISALGGIQSLNGKTLNGFIYTSGKTGTLKAQIAGTYNCVYKISETGTNDKLHFALAKNGVIQYNTEQHDKGGAAIDIHSVYGGGFIPLSVNDIITLEVENENSATSIDVNSVEVNCIRIGN